MCSCSFFFLPLMFTLLAARSSPFSHRRYKIFMFFFQRNWSPLLFIARSSSSSVIHVNVDIEIKSKERIGFFGREATRFTAETRGCLKCKISSRLTWRGRSTYGRTLYGRLSQKSKFLGCIDLPNFLTHGAPQRARELRYYFKFH